MIIRTGFSCLGHFWYHFWISPFGEIYCCDYHRFQGHNRVAYFLLTGNDLLKEFTEKGLRFDAECYDGQYSDKLRHDGWVRITRDGKIVKIDCLRHPTDAQTGAIEEYRQYFKHNARDGTILEE